MTAPELTRKAGKVPPEQDERYRATHGADGYGLGSARYPNNRAGRRAMARSWKGR